MKEFKEFLEKRWWQGIGGIAGIAALVLAVLQLRGIVHISGLAVSIAVNIILAVVLALVAVRASRWKRKYERVSTSLEEIKGRVEEQKEVRIRKRVLLPDPDYIWRLNIDNTLLTELYGQAQGRAITKFHDAKLRDVAILVFPYEKDEDRVSVHFGFYSQWADRGCTYIVSEMRDMRESRPDKLEKWERVTFDELPWLKDPNWPQFLKKSCEKVEPLSPADWTNYQICAMAWRKPPWSVTFEDGLTGKESNFSWDGKGEPIPEE